jgi:protein glucosyltransferase
VHTGGNAYSAGLKYKLACGSVVIMFESHFKEFFYLALKVWCGVPSGAV